MCVIAVARAGSPLPSFSMFHRMWESNPDGAGFCFPAQTEDRQPGLRIVKGLMTFTAFKDAVHRYRQLFADAENKATVDIGFHFRISSAGGKSPKLTHPFFCGPGVALMHNGHIGMLAYDSDALRDLTGASAKSSKKHARVLATFKDERETEMARLKEMVANEQITPGEAEQYAQLYLDKPDRSERAAEAAAERLHKLENPESDTSRLADILTRMPPGWQRNDVCQFLIREKFLHGDKIAIFDPKGLAVILNEKNGAWDSEGRWYSNTYWMPGNSRAGQLVSGKDMLKDSEGSVDATNLSIPPFKPASTTYASRTSATFGKSDRELREQSDRIKAKLEGSAKQENLWPTRPGDSELQRRRNTPRLGCTLPGPVTAPSLPPGVASEDDIEIEEVEPVDPNFYNDPMFRDDTDDGEQPATCGSHGG